MKVVLFTSIITSLMYFVAILLQLDVSRKLTSHLTLRAFWSSLSPDLTSFKPADTINTILHCRGTMRGVMGLTLWLSILEIAISVASILITIVLNWRMGICLAVSTAIILMGLPIKLYMRKYYETSNNYNPDNVALESLQNIKTVQLLSLQNYKVLKYTTVPKNILRQIKTKIFVYSGQQTLATLMADSISSTIFLVSCYFLERYEIRIDAIQTAQFMLVIACSNSVLLSMHLHEVSGGIEATNRLRKVAKPKNVQDDVTLSIMPSTTSIWARQTVGIVGKSGSGKTTLISLLEKFIEPTSGQILVDGISIKDYDTTYLRSQIGIVSQEPVLFNTSIRDNITYGVASHIKSAPEEEVISAAKAVGIHQFIMYLPMGYDTPVGEYGSQLSGGQKQRVAIARAFIQKPNIVILDEATSALDNRTEKSVREALEKLWSNRTTLIIDHRLSTIRHADVIVVLSNGRIVEKGSYEELMERRGYFYDSVKTNEM